MIMAFLRNAVDGVLREQWTNATQAGDPTPAGYTAWNADGSIATQRALTQAESDALAAQDTSNTQAANRATVQQQAQTALTNNATDKTQDNAIITQGTPLKTASITTLAQAQAAIQQLAQAVVILAQNDLNTKAELNGLIRLALQKFDATN
jgi:hypothetical protein